MTLTRPAIVAVLLVFLSARPGGAQEPIAGSFDELQGCIRLGEKLVLTDVRGATLEGRLSRLAGPSMDIRIGRNRAAPMQVSESEINNIVVIRRDRIWDGPLIGFAVGAGTAGVIELITSRGSQKFQGGSLVGLGNLSAIVGLVFDLLNKEKVTVYVQKPRN